MLTKYISDKANIDLRNLLITQHMTEQDYNRIDQFTTDFIAERIPLVGTFAQYVRALHIVNVETIIMTTSVSVAYLTILGYETTGVTNAPFETVQKAAWIAQQFLMAIATAVPEEQLRLTQRPAWIVGAEYFRDGEDRFVDALVITRTDTKAHAVNIAQNEALHQIMLAYSAITSKPTAAMYAKLLETNAYWIHVMHDRGLASLPSEVFGEASLDDNLSTSAEPTQINEAFFAADLTPRENIPEPWMLDAGCY